MLLAKQSTAIIVTIGPVLAADGVAVTDSVVGDFKISKNGGAPAALNGSATLTHRHTGHYSLSLTATDVNTLGSAEITCDDTVNACPIKEIMVLPANSYDAMVSGTGVGMRSDIQGIGADAQSATDLKDFADAGYDPATNKVEGVKLADTLTTYTGNTVQTGDSFARIGAPAGASVSADIAAVKAQTAAIEVDTAEIGAAGAGLTAADDAVMARLGAPAGASVSADIAAVKAQTAAIEIDTAEIGAAGAGLTAITSKTDALPTDPADQSLIIDATNAVMARLGAPVGASMSADIAAVQADADNIQTRLPAALSGGRMVAAVEAIDATSANKIADHTLRRSYANARASADGDAISFRSMLGAIAKLVNKWSIAAGTLTVYHEDDATAAGTQAVTGTAGADPVTTLDTN